MNYDIITIMEASKSARSLSQSALPDSPVIEDFIDRTPRASRTPHLAALRKQLATFIWPGELATPALEPPRQASSC